MLCGAEMGESLEYSLPHWERKGITLLYFQIYKARREMSWWKSPEFHPLINKTNQKPLKLGPTAKIILRDFLVLFVLGCVRVALEIEPKRLLSLSTSSSFFIFYFERGSP